MTVYFIGAGPGAPDLITVRGQALVRRCPVCLYAGSLVPRVLVDQAPGEVIDTASMTLERITEILIDRSERGVDIARLHTGDPSLFGAIAEQIRPLQARGLPYEIVPGVPAYAATAAALKTDLTRPSLCQTVILTRTQGKASPMPKEESLSEIAKASATLAIHLSIRFLPRIVQTLIPIYGPDCPVRVGYRVAWPDQVLIFGTLATIVREVRPYKITRTALILVGWVLDDPETPPSALYDKNHSHLLRSS